MRLIIFLCLLFCSGQVFTQGKTNTDSSLHAEHLDIKKLQREAENSKQMMDTFLNGTYKKIEDEEMKRSLEQNTRNLDAFIAAQKVQHGKEQRRLWIRISLCLLFLVIGVIGFRRKKKSGF